MKKNWQSERIRAVNLIVVGDRMQIILYAPRETVQSEKIQVNFFIIICIRGLKIRNDLNPRLQAVKTFCPDFAPLIICFKNVLEYQNRSKFARRPYWPTLQCEIKTFGGQEKKKISFIIFKPHYSKFRWWKMFAKSLGTSHFLNFLFRLYYF